MNKSFLSVFLYILLLTQPLHSMRKSLNEGWIFVKTPGNKTLIPQFDNAEKVHLPHTWNVFDVWDDVRGYYRDAAWYKKQVFIPDTLKTRKVFIYFEGANHTAALYVNGVKAGEHLGGYTAFRFDISNMLNYGVTNVLHVMVDNSYSELIAPISGDFSMLGGIYRDVYMEVTDKIHFLKSNHGSNGIFVRTNFDQAKAEFHVNATVSNETNKKQSLRIRTKVTDRSGKTVVTNTSKPFQLMPSSQTGIAQLLKLGTYKLWSPENPNLYHVETELIYDKSNQLIEKQCIRTGIRTITKNDSGQILLNGKPIKLMGVNRHQDHMGLGNALPDAVHRNDIRLMKEMGANFIRFSHYPHEPALLEACDELGLLVWDEISIVNRIGLQPDFEKNALLNMREMVLQHYNHPSVVLWGFMNEVLLADGTFPQNEREHAMVKNRELALKLNAVAKELDPTRLTVIAHHGDFDKYEKAGLNNITDVCGYNLYFGWYREGFDNFDRFVENFKSKYPATPIIISEYGAGSNAGLYARQPRRFDNSMNWFELLHEEYLHRILANDKIAGGAVWNFADFSSEGRKDTDPNMNNKGLFYYNRTPKDAAYLYASRLTKEPVVKIAVGKWTRRPVEVATGVQTVSDTIKLYSNCANVALVLNGKAAGSYKPDHICRIFAPLDFKNGKNELIATGQTAEGKTITDKVDIYYDFIPFPLADKSFTELCVNVGGHFDYCDSKSNEVWIADRPYRASGWGYVGGEEYKIWKGARTGGERVIFNTYNDPLFQAQRVGLREYRFDTAPGWYEVELLFAEQLGAKELKDAFLNNLGNDSGGNTLSGKRVFNVKVNNQILLKELDVMQVTGELTAAIFKFRVESGNKGLNFTFEPVQGSTILNGIKIRKI